MIKNAKTLLVAAVSVLAVGCASTPENRGDAPEAFVQVQNNITPPTNLTVYAIRGAGVRNAIGTVRPNQTTTLTVDGVFSGQYRFMARTTGGQEIVSQEISLGEGYQVLWDLDSNIISPL